MGPPTVLPSTEIPRGLLRATTVSTVCRDRGFANKDGDGKALAPPQTVKLARMAEVHRRVSEVCCRRSLCCSGIRAAGANTGAAAVEGRTVGGGAQRCVTLSQSLVPEVMLNRRSWGGWLCAPTPLLIALSLFSCPDLPCPFLYVPFPPPVLPNQAPPQLNLSHQWH